MGRRNMLLVVFNLMFFAVNYMHYVRNILDSVNDREEDTGSESGWVNGLSKKSRASYGVWFAQTRQVQNESFIPSDEKLKALSLNELMTMFHTYQDHFEFLCMDQKRIGSVFDGGKHVCVDKEIRPSYGNCLIYSFGSNNEFSFERDAMKWFGCEVHTFDPFIGTPHRLPTGCTFHEIGLGAKTEMRQSVQFKSLEKIMEDLKHAQRVIDILKIDIEMAEWEFLEDVIESRLLSRKVKQMEIELHYDEKEMDNASKFVYILGVLRKLHGAGFRIFSRERNTFCRQCTIRQASIGMAVTIFTEFSYINERFV